LGKHFDITNDLVSGKAPIMLALKKGDIVKYRCNCGEMILMELIGFDNNIPQWQLWDHSGYPIAYPLESSEAEAIFKTVKCDEGITVSARLYHRPKFTMRPKGVFGFWERTI